MKKKEGVLEHFVKPIIPEFKLKDVLQVVIGASILAIPVAFTEETWNLALELPILNIISLLAISVLFVSMFTYYQYHKTAEGKHLNLLVKRVVSTYALSFIVVSVVLGLIQKAPWATDALLAFKRAVIVAFPASMSAAIADTLK